MKRWKKALCCVLSLVMVMCLLPTVALAADTPRSMTGEEFLALGKDGNITLTEDVTLDSEWIVTTDTVLDLNGFTISNKSVTTSDYLGTITLKSGNLTINDSSTAKTGRVEGARFAVVVQGGTLTVNGGTFGKVPNATSAWNEPLFVGGGSGIINGGTFVDGSLEYFKVYEESGSLVINGGKFDSMPYYPAGNQGAAILAPEPDHTYMAAYASYGDFAAANSDSFTYHSATNTLTLTGNYNGYVTKTGDWSGFFLNRDVTIDLNGHTWDMKTSDGFYPFPFSEMVINGGTNITIKDSSTDGTGLLKNRTGNVLEVMGTLNLEGGTLQQVGGAIWGPTVQLDGNSVVNMTGGTVKGTQCAYEFKPVKYGTPGPIQLSISGGTIETEAVKTNDREDAVCNITGGTYSKPVDNKYLSDDVKYQVSQENSTTTSYHTDLAGANTAATANGGKITDLKAEVSSDAEVLAITLDANGGTMTVSGSSTKKYTTTIQNGTISVSNIEEPTRKGYAFTGWLDQNGEKRELTDTFDGNTYLTAQWVKNDDPPKLPGFIVGKLPSTVRCDFVDVRPMDYYFDAVNWAYEHGITGGTGKLTFSPDAPCTRAQAVTFLWRAMGSPAAKTEANFTDVKTDAYYAAAVNWAVENGITNGTSADKFSPDAPCTRAQIVTLLYRAIGTKSTSDAGFTDVPATAYYADAVNWATQHKVTDGTGANRFSPASTCTRAQIVTFLYRCFA